MLLALAIAGSLIILKTVDALVGLRVTEEQEIQGLDLVRLRFFIILTKGKVP